MDNRLHEEDIGIFPLLSKLWMAADVNKELTFNVIGQHLTSFTVNFNIYFPGNDNPGNGNDWINNPFLEKIQSYALDPEV